MTTRNRDMPDGGNLPDRLIRFAELVDDDSPLYATICRRVAHEPVVLEILAEAPHGQPAANILLAAVQYLLLGGADHPLAAHYRSDAAPSSGDPGADFVDFCAAHRDRLVEIVSTRTVQTNEVRRCTILLPIFSLLWERHSVPLALLEIGPSAGLNLAFDRYRYDYGDGVVAGDAAASLTLTTERRPPGVTLPLSMPEVAWRRGVDLGPLDVTDADDVRWGRALLWPEQTSRIERYEQAVAIVRQEPPRLVAGDALDVLPELVEEAPSGAALVVFHSFVLNQFTEAERSRLGDLMATASQSRPVDRVAVEMLSRGADSPEIVLTRYEEGRQASTETLGAAHHHGEWLRWDG